MTERLGQMPLHTTVIADPEGIFRAKSSSSAGNGACFESGDPVNGAGERFVDMPGAPESLVQIIDVARSIGSQAAAGSDVLVQIPG